MARDREILSDKDMIRKTLDIVEYLMDVKIDLTSYSHENFVATKDTNGVKVYTMNLAQPAIKHIEIGRAHV